MEEVLELFDLSQNIRVESNPKILSSRSCNIYPELSKTQRRRLGALLRCVLQMKGFMVSL